MDWQPIDTAPKDGTPVEIKFADGETAIARNDGLELNDRHNGWWDEDGLDFGYGASNPTHWRPRP